MYKGRGTTSVGVNEDVHKLCNSINENGANGVGITNSKELELALLTLQQLIIYELATWPGVL